MIVGIATFSDFVETSPNRIACDFSGADSEHHHGHRSQDPHPGLGPTSAKKFALLASISVHARKSSPSTAQTAQNQPIFASRANFFAVRSRIHSCRASFFALMGAAATSHHPPTASPETDDTSARTKQPISGHSPTAKASLVSLSLPQMPQGARLVTRAPTSRSRAARWTSSPRPCAT